MRISWLSACASSGLLMLALSGCSKEPGSNSSPATNANSQSATVTPSPSPATPSPSVRPRTPGGDPVDTAQLDAEIASAEKQLKKNPKDTETRTALAHSYLARGNALTGVRQYRAALGDYRRALKYDPENAEAQKMSAMIVNILQTMGREVPVEGQEPPPLPMKKEDKKN